MHNMHCQVRPVAPSVQSYECCYLLLDERRPIAETFPFTSDFTSQTPAKCMVQMADWGEAVYIDYSCRLGKNLTFSKVAKSAS